MTLGEIPNPRKDIPKAVNQTFWRIAVFYVLGVLVPGMAVPYNDPELLGATKQSTSAVEEGTACIMNITLKWLTTG